eukprot:scaffold13829_cov69-Phaeocystis_antarctica.AAC.3
MASLATQAPPTSCEIVGFARKLTSDGSPVSVNVPMTASAPARASGPTHSAASEIATTIA